MRWFFKLGALALIIACGGAQACAAKPEPAPTQPAARELAPGMSAPDFNAVDQLGRPVHLAELRGKPVVVYFYPKDETPGCTKEARAFRDAWGTLAERGVSVIGVSTDSNASHQAFAQHHQLPFKLVSDPSGEIAAKYGVPVSFGLAQRQSFVIAADGTLKKIYRKVDVAVHADEISADVR